MWCRVEAGTQQVSRSRHLPGLESQIVSRWVKTAGIGSSAPSTAASDEQALGPRGPNEYHDASTNLANKDCAGECEVLWEKMKNFAERVRKVQPRLACCLLLAAVANHNFDARITRQELHISPYDTWKFSQSFVCKHRYHIEN